MIDLKTIRQIYFIGIGGIGMSALARYFAFHGKEVSGYDKTPTNLTRALERKIFPLFMMMMKRWLQNRPTWSFTHPLCLHPIPN